MKMERTRGQQPTPQEQQELEQLKTIIDRATADGIVTRDEFERIQRAIATTKSPTAEHLFRAIELYRELVTEKVNAGELDTETLGQ